MKLLAQVDEAEGLLAARDFGEKGQRSGYAPIMFVGLSASIAAFAGFSERREIASWPIQHQPYFGPSIALPSGWERRRAPLRAVDLGRKTNSIKVQYPSIVAA